MEQRRFDLEERLIGFAVETCRIAEALPSTRLGNHVASQLLRSCTSPAANYAEARAGESPRDFLHKIKICLKELRETFVWLLFLQRYGLAGGAELQAAIAEADELISIFVASVRTAERNQRSRR
jgi:four helix bundle protein